MSDASNGDRAGEQGEAQKIQTSIRKLIKDNDLGSYLKEVRKVDMALQPQERKELKRYLSTILFASGTAFAIGALAPAYYIRRRRMQNRKLLLADFVFGSFVIGFSSFWSGVMALDIGLTAAPFYFSSNPRQREMTTLMIPIPVVSEWQKYFKDTYEHPDLLYDWNNNFVNHFKVIKEEAVKQHIIGGGPVPVTDSIPSNNSWGGDNPKQGEQAGDGNSAWDRLRQSAGKKDSAWDKVRNGLPPGPPVTASQDNQSDDDMLDNLNSRPNSMPSPNQNRYPASKPKDAWQSIREDSKEQKKGNQDFMTPAEFEKDMELEREGESIDDFTESEKKYSS